MINLKNKKVIITGATGGIGNSIIEKFYSEGAKVLGTGTNEEKLSKLKDDFNGIILTSKKGMNWYKKLIPKLSFDMKNFFFFKLKEIEGNKENIFSKNDIDLFIKQHPVTFNEEDKICYFKKKN